MTTTPSPEEQWQLIEPHLSETVRDHFYDHAKARFLTGAEQYQGQWMSMLPSEFDAMIIEEELDAEIYRAMQSRARFVRDLDDEVPV